MEFLENISLKHFNTFGIEARAEKFCEFTNTEELTEALSASSDMPSLILGGGSNVLLTQDISGVVLRNAIPGIETVKDDGDKVLIRSGAGESWHDLVLYAVERGFGGIENLSLIPGSVGAAPMQNIGAYGVEIKDVFQSLEALYIPSGELHRFTAEDCKFGYRESIFKRELKGQYVITSIDLELRRNSELNTSYGAIEQELQRLGKEADIKSISEAVINIRRSKLPDPAIIGNAGSFFKNPVIEKIEFETLLKDFPEIPNYPAPSGRKLAAGWLIEQAGWKGKDLGGYGVHDRQALVLVNRGGATGEKLFQLSEDILTSVKDKFGVQLEREVNVI
ncbi:MAG: UDP-N-acetylmuramate dehydrogenase [Flavobacteriales bacterium]|nr:UDP-N-acetylmuramate dehydrogenase [Flavobacteriales bacterium]